jgi:anti-sigma factor RsiW
MEHMDSEAARGFIQGTLPPRLWFRWEAHLPTCAACRELVHRERALRGLLNLDQDPPELPGAAERFLTQLAPAAAGQSGARGWPRFLLAVCLGGALGLALGLTWRLAVPGDGRTLAPAWQEQPAPFEQEVIAHLGPLETLAEDPWLADDYECVRWFEHLVWGEGGG